MDTSVRPDWANNDTAVRLYEAYLRIVAKKTKAVVAGGRLNASQVSKEAGFHRSTLNEERYPELYALIKCNDSKAKRATTAAQKLAQKSHANATLRQQLSELEAAHGDLLSKYISLGRMFLEAQAKLRTLGSTKVVPFGHVPLS